MAKNQFTLDYYRQMNLVCTFHWHNIHEIVSFVCLLKLTFYHFVLIHRSCSLTALHSEDANYVLSSITRYSFSTAAKVDGPRNAGFYPAHWRVSAFVGLWRRGRDLGWFKRSSSTWYFNNLFDKQQFLKYCVCPDHKAHLILGYPHNIATYKVGWLFPSS